MTTPNQRDTQLERWLSRSSGTDPVDSSACLDGETMAAWIDGALIGLPLKQAREHVAGCARCQATAAMLLGSDHVPATLPVDTAGWWSRWTSWAVPVAAAAAAAVALAVWVRTPAPTSGDPATFDVARSELKQSAELPAEAAATPGLPVLQDPSARVVSPPPDASIANQTSPAGPQNSAVPAAGTRPPMAARAREERLNEAMPTAGASAAKVAAFPGDGSVSTAASAADRATPATATAPALPSPASADALARTQSSAPVEAPAAAARVAAAPAPSAPTLQRADASGSGWTVVSSPPGTPRWRFLADQLQGSKDGGATWRAVPVDGSVAVRAFSVVGPQVCWLVGSSGLVLLTVDGDTWTRLPFPARADLISVVATDARSAVVSAADGRPFTTTDAGRTWSTR